MNSFPVTDENCKGFKQSNKGAIMSCPFEEPLEGQHTDKRGVPLFFVPFSEYLEEFKMKIVPSETSDLDLIKEFFTGEGKIEHHQDPIINVLVDMENEGVKVKLNEDATDIVFNKPMEDINVVYHSTIKKNKDAVINYLRDEAVLRTALKYGWWDNFEVPLRKQVDWVGRFLNAKMREKKMTSNTKMRLWGRDKWLLAFLTPERYLEFVKNKSLRWGDWNVAYRNARTFYFMERDTKKELRETKKAEKASRKSKK